LSYWWHVEEHPVKITREMAPKPRMWDCMALNGVFVLVMKTAFLYNSCTFLVYEYLGIKSWYLMMPVFFRADRVL